MVTTMMNMIKTARDNARLAGVEELIEFEVGDAAKPDARRVQ